MSLRGNARRPAPVGSKRSRDHSSSSAIKSSSKVSSGRKPRGNTSSVMQRKRERRQRGDNQVNWDFDSDDLASDNEGDDGEERGTTGQPSDEDSEAESEVETAQEKRARMAKRYIDALRTQGVRSGGFGANSEDESDEDDGSDDDDDDSSEGEVNGGPNPLRQQREHEAINKRLQEDVLRSRGRLRNKAAAGVAAALANAALSQYRGHRLPATCVALSETEKFALSASKDASIIRWDVETGRKLKRYPGRRRRHDDTDDSLLGIGGHWDDVLALAMSSDDKYMASGGRDNIIRIWDVRSDELIDSLQGHRDSITGLAFRLNTHQLVSASADRSVRVWNAADLSFVEALYGHQAEINAIASLYRDRAVSVSTDRSLRMWKIPEETQLVLTGAHSAALDCVAMIDEVHFVAGSQDGGLSLWHTSRKKPLSVVRCAHGARDRWVSSLASLRNTDLVVSGSSDGNVKLWNVDLDAKRMTHEPVGQYQVPGFVNGLACGISGRVIVAATGQEHRLGRWERLPAGRNGVHIARIDVDLDGAQFGRDDSDDDGDGSLESESEGDE